MKVVLERYHGLGNDYVVFDPNKNELELTEENVKMICDRNAGLGSDGMLEGPILKEDGMHVESGRKRVGNQRKRRAYICKILKGRKLYSKEKLQIIYWKRPGRGDLFK